MSKNYPQAGEGLLNHARRVGNMLFTDLREWIARDVEEADVREMDASEVIAFAAEQHSNAEMDGDYATMAYVAIVIDRLEELHIDGQGIVTLDEPKEF